MPVNCRQATWSLIFIEPGIYIFGRSFVIQQATECQLYRLTALKKVLQENTRDTNFVILPA